MARRVPRTWSEALAGLPRAEVLTLRARAARSPDPTRYRARKLAEFRAAIERENANEKRRKRDRARKRARDATRASGVDAAALQRDMLRLLHAAGHEGVTFRALPLAPVERGKKLGGYIRASIECRFRPRAEITPRDERFFYACESVDILSEQSPRWAMLRPGPEAARDVWYDHRLSVTGVRPDVPLSIGSGTVVAERTNASGRPVRSPVHRAVVWSVRYANVTRGPAHTEGWLNAIAAKLNPEARAVSLRFNVYVPDAKRLAFVRSRESDDAWRARIRSGKRKRAFND